MSIESRPVTVACTRERWQWSADSDHVGTAVRDPHPRTRTTVPAPGAAHGCVNVNDEVGIAQVQNSKLLTVNGNVYINSDVDSDVWSGGCPQTIDGPAHSGDR